MHENAQQWVERLGLGPHPEGGFFKETYRSDLNLPVSALGGDFSGGRSVSTSIYYLLSGEDFSALHRIRSDELWHFYDGSPLVVQGLHPTGEREDWILHNDPSGGHPQAIVAAGTWFGSRLQDPGGYALVGCTVAPGFDFSDFEMANREALKSAYPEHADWIDSLTR